MKKYILRLDDACPTMDSGKWERIERLLDSCEIKPIVAVIPSNKDPEMMIDPPDDNFWGKVKAWEEKGWQIALHGYDHCYISDSGGLIPMNRQSEFAGVSIDIQKEKLRKGINIFGSFGITTNIWVAPSHTFDRSTLRALKEETDIQIVSDGVALFPYQKDGFFWIPQQMWHFVEKNHGVWTCCLHPNMMSEKAFEVLENFCRRQRSEFICDIEALQNRYQDRRKTVVDEMYFQYFFLRRFVEKLQIYHWLRKIN